MTHQRERRLSVAVSAALAAVVIAAVGSGAALLAGTGPLVVTGSALAVLVAGGHGIHRARRRRRLGAQAPRAWWPAALTIALLVHPVGALPIVPGLALVLSVALVHLAARSDSDDAAIAAVAIGASVGLLATVRAPGLVPAFALPAAVVTGTAALVLVRARRQARDAAASRRVSLSAAPGRSAVLSRALAGVGYGLVLVLATFLLLPWAQTPPEVVRSFAVGERRAELERAQRERRRAEREYGPVHDDDEAAALAWTTELALFGRIPMPPYEVLMRVTPTVAGESTGPMGSLYLRGVVLSHFTEAGVRMVQGGAATRRRDASDGAADGWVTLEDADTRGGEVELLVEHFPAVIDDRGWSLLFAPLGLRSVELPEVRWTPDRYLALADAPDDWFGYRMVVRDPRAPRSGLIDAVARHPSERFVALPPPSPVLDRVRADAEEVMRGTRTDLRRVQSVIDHFRNGFEYELTGSEFGGMAAIDEFLDRRAGYCTYFASAAVLMLRTQGIPARVASGFLVRNWQEDGHYLAGPGDMHAWIEVHFEGVGWVAFEPTPPDLRSRAVAEQPFREPGVSEWTARVARTMAAWQRSGGTEADLGDVLAAVAEAPRRIGVSLRRSPVIAFLLATSLLALGVLLLRRRSTSSLPTRSVDEATRRAERLLARMDRALVRLGHPRTVSTPLRRHVETAGLDPEVRTLLLRIVDRLYRLRFSGAATPPEVGRELGSEIDRIDRTTPRTEIPA